MSTRLPSLESLRVFEASARHRNFSLAAKELCVSAAAVSLRVRDLEEDIGQSLFKRNGPRIELTEAGARLAARLGEAMSITRSAVEACRSDNSLRVTTTPTFAQQWLAEHLSRYEALPGAASIRIEVTPDVRSAKDFDVAVRSGHGDWPGMSAQRLLSVAATPMLAPELAERGPLRTPRDLLRLPLIPDDYWAAWFQLAGLQRPRLSFSSIAYESQDMSARAALAGVGVALLSPAFFGSLVRENKLIRPFEQVFEGQGAYYVLTHDREERASVDHFVRWLCQEIAATTAATGARL